MYPVIFLAWRCELIRWIRVVFPEPAMPEYGAGPQVPPAPSASCHANTPITRIATGLLDELGPDGPEEVDGSMSIFLQEYGCVSPFISDGDGVARAARLL